MLRVCASDREKEREREQYVSSDAFDRCTHARAGAHARDVICSHKATRSGPLE